MELPKNITQIGEWDPKCKIYVEDYVISYIKQLNNFAKNKEVAVAFYGTRKEEEDKSYLFLYGAGKLDLLQKEARHLSQAQKQEIEGIRKKYFPEYEFLGYRILNGEMVEGFHISEQDICRYIEGYAQFYEKNDGMLAYMLEVRNNEPAPEVVDQEKFEEVKRRQEERKRVSESEAKTENRQSKREAALHKFQAPKEKEPEDTQRYRRMQRTAVAVFGGLCLIGLYMMGNGGRWSGLSGAVKETMAELNEQKLPETVEVMGSNVQADTLIAEDRLTQALQEENLSTVQEETESSPAAETEKETELESKSEAELELESESEAEPEESAASSGAAQETESETVREPVSYTIKKGDTLIAISIRNCGSDRQVQEICLLNHIENPDDIKVGQKILLP